MKENVQKFFYATLRSQVLSSNGKFLFVASNYGDIASFSWVIFKIFFNESLSKWNFLSQSREDHRLHCKHHQWQHLRSNRGLQQRRRNLLASVPSRVSHRWIFRPRLRLPDLLERSHSKKIVVHPAAHKPRVTHNGWDQRYVGWFGERHFVCRLRWLECLRLLAGRWKLHPKTHWTQGFHSLC